MNQGMLEFVKKIFPQLETNIKKSGIKLPVDVYIKKYLMFTSAFTILVWLFFVLIVVDGITTRGWDKLTALLLPVFLIVIFALFFFMLFNLNKFAIKSRQTELESDLLYSSRYLLLKLESGASIMNALEGVSRLHTRSARFFGELVSDIYLGDSIEEAVAYGIKYSPSKSFTKVLEEIENSLRTGSDLEKSLKAILKDMMDEYVIKIETYGKKLSPVSMFYMIIGAILPSMGSAFIVMATGFISLSRDAGSIIVWGLIVSLVVTQFFFIIFFKSLKPASMA